jgi:hypothetical protein
MAGIKESYQVDLNADHMSFVQSAREKYEIADDGKVMRIILDYVMTNHDIHDTVFKEVRCLRCE